MNAFEWDMAKAQMGVAWGAEVETRIGDPRTSTMWFNKLRVWEFADISAAIDELWGTHDHMPALSTLREMTIAAKKKREREMPSITGPAGGAREWEAEKIAEAQKYAVEYGMSDEWLGKRVAAIRTDGPFTERAKALENGDVTPFADWWARTFEEPSGERGGMPERIGDIIRRGNV